MQNLTITEAVKVIPVSESKLRRDMKAGVVSYDVDANGKKRFDPSELVRVYGQIDLPETNRQVKESNLNPSETRHDRDEILAIKDNQIADLQKQLEKAEMRETALIDEKSKLLDLLSAEKDEKQALMPPVEEQKPKTRNWLLRLVGAR